MLSRADVASAVSALPLSANPRKNPFAPELPGPERWLNAIVETEVYKSPSAAARTYNVVSPSVIVSAT